MKGLRIVAILSVLLLFGQVCVSQKPALPFVKNEVLVKFEASLNPELTKPIHEGFGAFTTEVLGDLGWQRVVLPEGLSVQEALARYREHEAVIAVQPNFYYSIQQTPNDPMFPNAGMYGLGLISAPQAWNITTGSASVVVANVDTGMRYTHEDLAANMWTNPGEIPGNGIDDDGNGFIDDYYGYDFRFDHGDPLDQHGHGTHVGGTIGAVGNNGVGVVGVNWNVSLMAIKIFSQAANDTTSAMLINSYNYIRMMKERGVNIRVANHSYSGCPEACGYDQATKDAIDALGEAGVLNVFAAGNNNRNTDLLPAYPGSYSSPGILNVAATTSTDARAGFSNWGLRTVDIAAPGAGILSTTNGSDSSYGPSSGTSMAAPHVAGAAALLASHHPHLSAASLKATILNTVDPIKSLNGLIRTGGRLNVHAAIQNPTVCEFVPAFTEMMVPTKGGVFSLDVTAAQNCDFSAVSSEKWLSMIDNGRLSGTSKVLFRVTVNPTVTRMGTIRVAGQDIVIRQSRTGK
jgi:subtilisin family serine protease